MTRRQEALLILAQFFLQLGDEARRLTALEFRDREKGLELTAALLGGRIRADLNWNASKTAVRLLRSGEAERAAAAAARRARLIGAELLFCGEDGYPLRLAELEQPPPVLFVRGNSAVLSNPTGVISMVGSRRASALGLSFAGRAAAAAAARGLTVVSGLALGTDAAVHTAVLAEGGLTAAVLASGPDSFTPRTNAALGRRILEKGAVVTEMSPGTQAMPWVFPLRNRIIAGLARRVVVFEAASGSGSTITGELALQYGRALSVMPGRPGDPLTAGGLELLQLRGAELLTDVRDLFNGSAASGTSDAFAGLDPDLHRLALLLQEELPCTVDELPGRLGLREPGQIPVLLGSINLLVAHGLLQEDLFGRLQFITRVPDLPSVR